MSTKKEDYLCLSAMLRAREPKLLNGDKAQRMLDAASFAEAAKQLVDCGYEDMSQLDANGVNAALNDHRNAILHELQGLVPEEGLVELFQLKYDYHNAKTIIKAEAMGQEAERLLSASGRMAPDALLSAYNEERYTSMPGLMGEAMADAKGILARTNNPQMADSRLDKAYFAELTEVANKMNNAFLTEYVRLMIDSTNLKIAVRTLRMGRTMDSIRDVLLDGGTDVSRIAAAGDGESLISLFAHSKLEKAAAAGAEAISGGSLTPFELECDNAVTSQLKSAKLMSYGPESVVAYIAAVENEITAVRMILTGFLDGIDSARTKERLRDTYA